MKNYYIYHVPGIKIGVTVNVPHRMAEQGFTEWEHLETHTNIYEVSDREIELQKEYGLPVDKIPYWQAVQNRHKWTKDAGDKGRANGAHILGGKALKGIPKAAKYKTTEHTAQATEASRRRIVCEHCGKDANTGNYSRWHGDNCKHKKR